MAESFLDCRKSSNVIEVDENNIPQVSVINYEPFSSEQLLQRRSNMQIDEIILDDQESQALHRGTDNPPHRFSLLQSGLRRNQRFASLREPTPHKHLLQVKFHFSSYATCFHVILLPAVSALITHLLVASRI